MNGILISDGAVWQRGAIIPLEGIASPGTRVRATFRGQTWESQAANDVRWSLELGPFDVGDAADLKLEFDEDPPLILRDILVGDVWICAGQSNMEMALKDADGGVEEAAKANSAMLRLYKVPQRVSDYPLDAIVIRTWRRDEPTWAGAFSAVGYWFGKRLQESLGVPIGIVQAAVGATPGEAWMTLESLERDAELSPIIERWKASLAAFPDSDGRYAKAFAQWDHDADLAEREGRPIPGAHPKLVGPGHTWTPGGLFNGMIAPVTHAPITGVAWYQGAGAPDRAFQYRKLFRTLIRDWRRAWNRSDLPFLFVQEARFGPRRDEPGEHSWAELREAQAMALAEPHTAMVVAIDTGDEKDIHPREKRPLGERLALAARGAVYTKEKWKAAPWSGPVFREMKVEGGRVRLKFDHAEGLQTRDGGPLRGFAISAGASDFTKGNRGFVWANAEIEGEDVVVWSEKIAKPQAVRYAWAQNPDCNLINAARLPASPFRTDDWPGVTVANR